MRRWTTRTIRTKSVENRFPCLAENFSTPRILFASPQVPRRIAEHILLIYGVHHEAMDGKAYDASGSRYRFIARIREHLWIKNFDGLQYFMA
jgi:hypothetical protein